VRPTSLPPRRSSLGPVKRASPGRCAGSARAGAFSVIRDVAPEPSSRWTAPTAIQSASRENSRSERNPSRSFPAIPRVLVRRPARADPETRGRANRIAQRGRISLRPIPTVRERTRGTRRSSDAVGQGYFASPLIRPREDLVGRPQRRRWVSRYAAVDASSRASANVAPWVSESQARVSEGDSRNERLYSTAVRPSSVKPQRFAISVTEAVVTPR
jgi:hypothetical protein